MSKYVAALLLIAACSVQPVNADESPKAGLTPQDCWDAGLYVVYGDDYPNGTGWRNGFICVEHVNP